jgi:hypothetical protein
MDTGILNDTFSLDDFHPYLQLNRVSEAADFQDEPSPYINQGQDTDPVTPSTAVQPYTGLTPAQLSWSAATTHGETLCRLSGLSSQIWGAGAAFAAHFRGPQVNTMALMVHQLPTALHDRAIFLLACAKQERITLHHPRCNSSPSTDIIKFIQTHLIAERKNFYVGITEAVHLRFIEHREGPWKFQQMDAWLHASSTMSGDCECVVLRSVGHHHLCRNRSGGGEHRSNSQPHFTYVVW